jgi:hypothetical protein
MLTLYGAKGSAAAIEAALQIAAAPFRWIEAAGWEPGPGLEASGGGAAGPAASAAAAAERGPAQDAPR